MVIGGRWEEGKGEIRVICEGGRKGKGRLE